MSLGLNILLSLLVIVVFLLYKRIKKNLDYWKIRNIPYVKPVYPLVGNYLDVVLGRVAIAGLYQRYYNEMKDAKYFGINITTQPSILVKDPELIQRIFIKDFNHFYDRGFPLSHEDILGRNLFFMEGKDWKNLRLKTVPVFSSAKLKSMSSTLEKCCEDLIEYMNTLNIDTFGTKPLMEEIFTDILSKTICGVEIHSIKNPNRKHVNMQAQALSSNFRTQIKNILNFSFPSLSTKIDFFPTECTKYFYDLTMNSIKLRKEQNIRRNDFIQLLNDIYENENKLPPEERFLTDTLLVGNVFILLVAGFETSSSTASNVLHELAYCNEVQEQVREELLTIYAENGNKIDYETCKKMKFLDQVISETLRLNPLVNAIFRVCTEDYQIPGTNDIIEKGVAIHIPTYSIHRDPKYWKDPLKFDPNRFSEENISSIIPGTFTPFGEGPRICIGKRFAFLQLKMVLSKILLNYKVSPCEKSVQHPELVKNALLAGPEGEFWLKYTKL